MDAKDKDLRIRCRVQVRRKFKEFVAKHDFPNFEEALNWLLNHHTEPPPVLETKAPIKSYIGSAHI